MSREDAYEEFKNYISESDWKSYTQFVARTGEMTPLADWVYVRNRESMALTVAEVATCLTGILGTVLGASSRDAEGLLVVGVIGWVGCGLLPLVDGLDVGSVTQSSPPPPRATLPPRLR